MYLSASVFPGTQADGKGSSTPNNAAPRWLPSPTPPVPLAENADHLLLARSDMASFVDSLVAPLSLINAMIVAVGMKRKEEISQTYAKLERIWDEFEVYEKQRENNA